MPDLYSLGHGGRGARKLMKRGTVVSLRQGKRVQDKNGGRSVFSVSESESAWVSALGFSVHFVFSRCFFFLLKEL